MAAFAFRRLFAVCLLAGLFSGTARAEEIVIIESTAPGIEAGAILDSADKVSVPEGAMIVVVEADGSTRTIDGPYEAALDAAAKGGEADGGLIANLGKLVSERENERQVLGAIRAAPGQVPQEIYVVDIGRSGNVCVPADGEIVLWRPETMAAESETTLSDMDSGGDATVLWSAGEQTLDWPAALTPRDGARYAVRLDIAPRPAEIRLRLVPGKLQGDAARAAWMAGAGCRRQAERLLARLED